jgi:hypothetical protein
MPAEDPTRDDGLRIGGWLEASGEAQRALPGRPPLVTPPPVRVPVFRPLPRRRRRLPRQASAAALPLTAGPLIDGPLIDGPLSASVTSGGTRPLGLKIAAGVAVAAAVTALVVTLAHGGRTTTADPAPTAPVTLAAAPAPTSAVPANGEPSPSTASPSASRTTKAVRQATPVATRHPITAPPRAGAGPWAVGSVISLAVRNDTAYRVRHRDFLGHVDRIGSALDRADSRFTVRTAVANGCVSLESVNYPGYFLRHRDFVIRLDRADGSDLFRLDSTFCPVPAGGGGFVLRSQNYPTRYVTAFAGALFLPAIPASRATAFVVTAPS